MNWIIVGAGITGQSLAKCFKNSKDPVFVFDDRSLETNKKKIFESCFVKHLSEKNALKLIEDKNSTLLISPGIKNEHPLLKAARKNKRTILSELEFTLNKIQTPVIAITGTNGKSTVASMCEHIIKESGYKTKLLGNIGTPLSSLLLKPISLDFLVLEISSYQLEQVKKPAFFRSIFLNFSKDHIERHKTLKNYFKAKWKIFSSLEKNKIGFCDQKAFELAKSYGFLKKEQETFLKKPSKYYAAFVPKNLNFPSHNTKNAAISIQICRSFLTDKTEDLAKTLKNFKTIPHRFEIFAKKNKTFFIDDSKATNLDSTMSALNSLKGKKIILFLGGLSKGSDFKELLKHKKKIHKAIYFGSASDKIKKALGPNVPSLRFGTLKEALSSLDQTLSDYKKADLVLLSPACASHDEFRHFSERGLFFQKKMKHFLKKTRQPYERKEKLS